MPFETLPLQTRINIIEHRLSLMNSKERRHQHKSEALQVANASFSLLKYVMKINQQVENAEVIPLFSTNINMIKIVVELAEKQVNCFEIGRNLPNVPKGGSYGR